MRAEIGQNTGALITPSGIAHEPRRAVTVEHPAGIDRTEFAAGDEVTHAHEVRLEAVIVGGIANDAVAPRERLEAGDFGFVFRPQWLLDQHVLAIVEAVGENVDLGLVRDAGQDRVVVRERNIRDRPVTCVLVHRIDSCDKVGARDSAALVTLNTETGDHDPHR